jgi:hypothetical protein
LRRDWTWTAFSRFYISFISTSKKKTKNFDMGEVANSWRLGGHQSLLRTPFCKCVEEIFIFSHLLYSVYWCIVKYWKILKKYQRVIILINIKCIEGLSPTENYLSLIFRKINDFVHRFILGHKSVDFTILVVNLTILYC